MKPPDRSSVLIKMINLKIIKWNDDHAWTDWSGHAKTQLVARLKEYGGLPLTKTKRLVRQILERKSITFQLPRIEGAEGIRHVLESLGAEVLMEANSVEDYCCNRFQESVTEGKFQHSNEPDETEWFMPEWLHIYYCPFCGESIKGKGFGSYDQERDKTTIQQATRPDR